jgi:V8-like Glu-specific endopeptidase
MDRLAGALTHPGWSARVLDSDGRLCGSAFLVDNNHALTCAHVVLAAHHLDHNTQARPGNTDVRLHFDSLNTECDASVEEGPWVPREKDGSGDLAVLTLPRPPSGGRPVALWHLPDRLGTKVWLRGHTADRPTGANATARSTGPFGSRWTQVLLANPKRSAYRITEGFSGAAVWDYESQAYVGGMLVSIDKAGDEQVGATMLPTEQLIALWPDLNAAVIKPPRPKNTKAAEKRRIRESEAIAWRVAAEVQWPDEEIRRIDRIDDLNDRPWVVSLMNWSDVPVTKVVATIANDRDAVSVEVPTLQPHIRQWYILRRPEVDFDSESEDPPEVAVEFSALGVSWHLENGDLLPVEP